MPWEPPTPFQRCSPSLGMSDEDELSILLLWCKLGRFRCRHCWPAVRMSLFELSVSPLGLYRSGAPLMNLSQRRPQTDTSPKCHQLWERGDARQKAFEVSPAHVTRAEKHQDALLKALLAHVSRVRSFLHTYTRVHFITAAYLPPFPCLAWLPCSILGWNPRAWGLHLASVSKLLPAVGSGSRCTAVLSLLIPK